MKKKNSKKTPLKKTQNVKKEFYYNEPEKNTIIGYSDSRGFVDKDGKTPSDMQTPKTAINVNADIPDINKASVTIIIPIGISINENTL